MSDIFGKLARTPDSQDYAAKLQELQQWLLLANPELDVYDVVLVAALLGPVAKYVVDNEVLVDSLEEYGRLSSNIFNSIEDEELLDELRVTLADSLGVAQSPAGYAVGEVIIKTSSDRTITIPQGTVFNNGSIQFQASSAVILRSVSQQVGSNNERPLLPTPDGMWEGRVPLSAITPGVVGNISLGTTLSADLQAADLVSITASTNFVGGRDANSLQDLIDAVFASTAARTLGTRDQIVAFAQTKTNIGNIRQVGVIGFGDREMLRDKHSFLPLQAGGMADVYLASEFYPTLHDVPVTGALTFTGSDSSQFTIGVDRDASPGFLRVLKVVDPETGVEAKIDGIVRALDTSPILGQQVPRLSYTEHGTFSRFQTAVINCSLPAPSALAVGDTKTFIVTFQRVPGIDTAQTEFSSRNARYVGGDTLVRSAIPCFLRIRLRLISAFETNIVSAADMQAAVAAEIMRRPMRPEVYRSDIVQALGRYLPDDLAVESIEYEGLLIRPSGQQDRLVQSDSFVVPSLPEQQLTARTIALYTAPSDVLISVTQQLSYTTP